MRITTFAAVLLAAQAVSPSAAAFNYDTTFNGSGQVQDFLDLGSSKADFFADVAYAPSTGSLYSVGRSEHVASGGATFGVLFKRLSNGAKDYSFANGGSGPSRVYFGAERSGGSSGLSAVAFDGSNTGAVLVAGFNDLNNNKRCGVVYKVLDNAVMKGALDGGFGVSGRFAYCAPTQTSIEFTDLKVLPDGRAVVSGNGQLATSERYGFLLRLTPTGQLDTTFNGSGSVMFDIRPGKNDVAMRIAVGAQGYYVAGNSTFLPHWDAQYFHLDDVDVWVARVTTSGVLDTAFGSGGKRIEAIDLYNSDKYDALADLTLDASGRVVLLIDVNPAHFVWTSGAQDVNRFFKSRGVVIRLATSGARDSSFGTGGRRDFNEFGGSCPYDFCDYDQPQSIVTTASNEVLIAGRYVPGANYESSPLSQASLLFLSADGLTMVGERFTTYPRSEGISMLRQLDGKIVVGGLVRTVSNPTDVDFSLSRFLP